MINLTGRETLEELREILRELARTEPLIHTLMAAATYDNWPDARLFAMIAVAYARMSKYQEKSLTETLALAQPATIFLATHNCPECGGVKRMGEVCPAVKRELDRLGIPSDVRP